jgi:hypothetical protein
MKALSLIALLLCTSAFAYSDQKPDPSKRHGPPPEALEACKGKAAGTAVEMKTPRGDSIKGTCRMVMVPDRDPPREQR